MLKIGDKAPTFRLKNDSGNDVALYDFAGKRVVLFFYPKANTPG
jgi:peroxiredoxin Q/BCP